ncbi:MAG: hypothetical protein ABI555_01165 [Chloroflexota bacterium]
MSELSIRPPVALLLAIAIVAGACSPAPTISPGSDTPSPAASLATPAPGATLAPDAAATYRAIADQVAVIRHLDSSDRVEPVVIDEATLRTNLAAQFEKDNPPEEIAKSERILMLLGLLTPETSLKRVYLDLQGSQVIGYYDQTAKELYIVSRSGAIGAMEELTYAHEFTHELQDRHFDLNAMGLDTIRDDSDRLLAILALVEGDAVSVQTAWMVANLTTQQLGEVAAAGSDPEMLAVMSRTPRILLETSLFPYQAGATFVGLLQGGQGGQSGYAGVDAAYGRLPVSTEQIIHPEAYLSGELPLKVTIPPDFGAQLGVGWSVAAQDTFGELQTRVWLREGGVEGEAARIAAAGWGGDRLALLDGPGGGSMLIWSTAWDTAADAAEFAVAASAAISGYPLDALVDASGSRVAIAIRSGAAPDGAGLRSVLAALVRG